MFEYSAKTERSRLARLVLGIGRMNKSKILGVSMAAVALVAPAVALAQPCHGGDEAGREICKPREIYLMPGLQGVVYAPVASAATPYVGAGVHLAPLQWSHNSDDFGPSQGSVFVQASLLRSESSSSTMSLFEGGTTLSFERNSSRGFMIPYFGATVGALHHAELPDAGYGFPMLGLHAIYNPHVMIDLEGGYVFPFSDLDTLRGPRGDMVARFSMW